MAAQVGFDQKALELAEEKAHEIEIETKKKSNKNVLQEALDFIQ